MDVNSIETARDAEQYAIAQAELGQHHLFVTSPEDFESDKVFNTKLMVQEEPGILHVFECVSENVNPGPHAEVTYREAADDEVDHFIRQIMAGNGDSLSDKANDPDVKRAMAVRSIERLEADGADPTMINVLRGMLGLPTQEDRCFLIVHIDEGDVEHISWFIMNYTDEQARDHFKPLEGKLGYLGRMFGGMGYTAKSKLFVLDHGRAGESARLLKTIDHTTGEVTVSE